ncbi:hypothetical protein OSTOST_03200, partial [Ostertagia ostertagi]
INFSFVEADLNALRTTEYLRSASVFTAVCGECGEEIIIERASTNWYWCTKCFSDQHLLRSPQLSYRVRIPVAYSRADGQMAQLALAISRAIWAGVPGGSRVMSEENVVELYSERDTSHFVRNLNNTLRFTEAVMRRMKISNVVGKIVKLDRKTGSIDLFVDRCTFKDRRTSNEIFF